MCGANVATRNVDDGKSQAGEYGVICLDSAELNKVQCGEWCVE